MSYFKLRTGAVVEETKTPGATLTLHNHPAPQHADGALLFWVPPARLTQALPA